MALFTVAYGTMCYGTHYSHVYTAALLTTARLTTLQAVGLELCPSLAAVRERLLDAERFESVVLSAAGPLLIAFGPPLNAQQGAQQGAAQGAVAQQGAAQGAVAQGSAQGAVAQGSAEGAMAGTAETAETAETKMFLFSKQGGPGPRKGRGGEHSPRDQKRSALRCCSPTTPCRLVCRVE